MKKDFERWLISIGLELNTTQKENEQYVDRTTLEIYKKWLDAEELKSVADILYEVDRRAEKMHCLVDKTDFSVDILYDWYRTREDFFDRNCDRS